MGRRALDFIKSWWRTWLYAFLFTIVVAFVFNIMRGDPNLSYAMVAFGTLLLAIVTAFTIDNSRQQEKRRMEEDKRVREEERGRDFKRRCIDDIHEWAQTGAALLTELYPSYDTSTQRENLIRLAPLRAVNNWMMNASRQFDDNQLPRLVDAAAQDLKEYLKMLNRPVLGGRDIHERCRESFVKLLECIADLKVKFQL